MSLDSLSLIEHFPDESEELEEIHEEAEKDRKEMEGQNTSEGESGVGSSASSIATKLVSKSEDEYFRFS